MFLHHIECLGKRIQIELLNFCQIFVSQFFEHIGRFDFKFDRLGVINHQEMYNFLKTGTIPINDGNPFKVIDIVIIFTLVLEFIENILHVDFEKIGVWANNREEFLFIDDFKGLFCVGFENFEEFIETFFYFCSCFVVVVDIECFLL